MGGLETSLWMKSFKPIFLSLIKAERKKKKTFTSEGNPQLTSLIPLHLKRKNIREGKFLKILKIIGKIIICTSGLWQKSCFVHAVIQEPCEYGLMSRTVSVLHNRPQCSLYKYQERYSSFLSFSWNTDRINELLKKCNIIYIYLNLFFKEKKCD